MTFRYNRTIYLSITYNMSVAKKEAHNILANTILGFVAPGSRLLCVTESYEVADLSTGKIVSTPGLHKGTAVDAYAKEVASHTHAVFGRDIASGISMTVAKRNAKPSQNIGLAITTMRTGGDKGWSIVETLAQSDAVRLMHKWYIEHGLMDLYMRKKCTAINGFREWVCGDLIEFFSPNNKLQWYGHVMDIDYEMETKGCEFSECLCDTKVPAENHRHVIPNQFYDRFGLFDYKTRMVLWVKGKPETSREADIILHKARLDQDKVETAKLMAPIQKKARRVRDAEQAGRELDRKAIHDLLIESGYTEEEVQRKTDIETMMTAFREKQRRDLATGGGGKRRCGITWAGPVKYIDPFRGQGEADRLAAMRT